MRTEKNRKEENRDIGRSGEGIPVSLFRGYSDTRPVGVVSLSDFLLQPTCREQIETLRRCKDKARRRALKSRLPAITPSGIFSKRCNSGLVRHSGFICIDIDGQDNPDITDWEALKPSISDLTGLWYAGLSASGNGLFLLFRIKYPERHTDHFHALSRDLRERGLVVDVACKDLARLRGTSYDPDPLYYPDAIHYDGLITPTKASSKSISTTPRHGDLTTLRVDKLVAIIEATGTNIAEFYPDWYAVGRSLASEFGESGRGWFHSISRQSAKYNLTECDRQYTRCLENCSSTSINTFFFYCKRHGITLFP